MAADTIRSLNAQQQRLIRMMRETGASLRISGIAVTRWCVRDPGGRLQSGVTPMLSQDRSAYRADIRGQRVSISAAWTLIKNHVLQAERGWKIRGRFTLREIDDG